MDFKEQAANSARNIIKELDSAYGILGAAIGSVDVDNLPENQQAEIKAGLEELSRVEKLTSPALKDLVDTLNKKR